MKILAIERSILDFLRKHFSIILIIFITIIALLIRLKMFNFESGDFLAYLKPWSEEIKNRGLRNIFSSGGIGDYNSPYILLLWFLTKLPLSILTSIKIVSVLFDFGLAIMTMLIVRYLLKNRKTEKKKSEFLSTLAYIIVMLLPTVMLNSALWGQCDSIYAFFVLTSIYFLIKKKFSRSFIFLGLAFSFKLQFIFVLPIYLLIYLKNKEFSILNFCWITVVLIILSIPALICGLPFWNIFGIYFIQIGEYQKLTLASMNIYMIFDGSYEYISLIGYTICALLFCALFYYFMIRSQKINTDYIIPLMLLSILVCICFLPSMHERYGYLAGILAIIYFIVGYGSLLVPITVEILSLLGYFSYLFRLDIDNYKIFGFLPMLTIIYVWQKLVTLEEKNTKNRLKF